MAIYDAQLRRKVKQLKVGRGAVGILISPDGTRVFVASSSDNYVAVVDVKTIEVTSRIIDVSGVCSDDGGNQPRFLTVSKNRTKRIMNMAG